MSFKTSHRRIAQRAFALGLALLLVSADAFAGGGGHGKGFPWSHLIVSFINFGIFLGILVKFALPKANDYFAERRKALMADLDAAKAALAETQSELDGLKQKLADFDEERDALMAEYHKQGQAEKERLVADAERHAEKLRADAEILIKQETKKAIARLETMAVTQAVELAQSHITERLQDQKRQRNLVSGFVQDLKKMESIDRRVD